MVLDGRSGHAVAAGAEEGAESGPGEQGRGRTEQDRADAQQELLFEYWPRSLRDPRAAALDSALTERQVAVYYGILVLGEAQGHFRLTDSPRLLASSLLAMEDGYQMEVLAGRRTRAEVIGALHAYARAVTGHDPGAA
ncbi:hypothetical protein ACWCYY_22745 [Kitasatospora sp. NPDC001664]